MDRSEKLKRALFPGLGTTKPHTFRPRRRQDGSENPMECRHCGGVPAAAVHQGMPPFEELTHKFKPGVEPETCRRCGRTKADRIHAFRGLAKEPVVQALIRKGGAEPPKTGGRGAGPQPAAVGDRRASASKASLKGKVRLRFPSLKDAPPELVEFIALAVRGAVRSAFDAHGNSQPRHWRGMMIGSITKRALNQICCAEGVKILREAVKPGEET